MKEGRFLLFSLLLSLAISTLFAQSKTSQPDSQKIQLQELKVVGILNQKYMVGQLVQTLDSLQIMQGQFQTMADFLQYFTPINFKSYGVGQATSISFRGTSPNHTALLWNGININQPSLGQTDFSTISVGNFDKISLQYGASGSVVGTDAVGGSISLNSSFPISKNFAHVSLSGTNIDQAKPNYFTENITLGYAQKKTKVWQFSGRTQMNASQFNSPLTLLSLGNYPYEPSSSLQNNLLQDFYLQNKNGNLWDFHAWISTHSITIQPEQIAYRQVTMNNAYRFLGSYHFQQFSFSTGFIRDILNYNTGDLSNEDHSRTDRFFIKGEREISLNIFNQVKMRNFIKIGTEFSRYFAKVDGYGNQLFSENRGDVYVLIKQNFSKHLSSSFNLRQAFTTGYHPPFCPSFGLEYRLFSNFILSGNLALGYRVPTLNERYWKVLGNSAIKPEQSFNKEIGLQYKYEWSKELTLELRTNLYHNLVNNWTYWNPDNNYKVENLLQVLAKGCEFFATLQQQKGNLKSRFSLIYAYTSTTQQKAYNAYSVAIIGKQLPYIPEHTLNVNFAIDFKQMSGTIQGLFNSERFLTTDNSGIPFAPYFLLNTSFSYKQKIQKNIQSNFIIRINNLSNTIYPNSKKNAMPGRNFTMGMNFNF